MNFLILLNNKTTLDDVIENESHYSKTARNLCFSRVVVIFSTICTSSSDVAIQDSHNVLMHTADWLIFVLVNRRGTILGY